MMVGVNPCGVHASPSNVRGEIADAQLIKHSPMTTVGVNPCGVHVSPSKVRKDKTGDGQVSSHSPRTTVGVNPCGVHVASSKARKKETGDGQAMRYSPLEVGVNPCGGKDLLRVSSSEVGRSEIESGVPDTVSLASVPAGDGFLTDDFKLHGSKVEDGSLLPNSASQDVSRGGVCEIDDFDSFLKLLRVDKIQQHSVQTLASSAVSLPRHNLQLGLTTLQLLVACPRDGPFILRSLSVDPKTHSFAPSRRDLLPVDCLPPLGAVRSVA